MTTLFINGSSRTNGNTVAFGERLLAGIPHTTLHLIDQRLNFDLDQRGTGQPQRDTRDDYEALMAQFAAADDIVIGTPVYWYNMSGQLKTFMDRWFDSFTTGFDFAGKRVYLLVVGVDDPANKATDIISKAFAESCDWLKMTYMGAATAIADGPTDLQQQATLPAEALKLRQALVTMTQSVSRETKS
ncbi:flavodoxin family protein [Levilactobacillus namurensis]|uniref:Flavodoxin family protein n=1 Tax=Levilactobacillus namurensis TaxID=380393 RepID=A0AAW8W005_9LACO|nr:flavodoxin family protein [Levilactobacillus namurensis]MDT7013291.1 flavodoxin family protein [Levilactobacillus namurensis]